MSAIKHLTRLSDFTIEEIMDYFRNEPIDMQKVKNSTT